MTKKETLIVVSFLLIPLCVGIIRLAFFGDRDSSDSMSSLFSSSKKHVAVIEISGVIYESEDVVDKIVAYRKDPTVAAILLRIDSPGGLVAPSQEIYHAVLACRKESETSKPVIVSMGSVAASGGYYIASAAERIFANNGTLTGSIGVIMSFPRYGKLLEKIGVGVNVITAGKYKDAGSPYRELSTMDRRYFEDLLHDTHGQFVKDVATGRNMELDTIRLLSEGQIYTGNQAQKNGLVDTVGTYEEVKGYILAQYNLPKNTAFIAEDEIYPFFFGKMKKNNHILTTFFARSGAYYLAESLLY